MTAQPPSFASEAQVFWPRSLDASGVQVCIGRPSTERHGDAARQPGIGPCGNLAHGGGRAEQCPQRATVITVHLDGVH
eukprot:4028888-Lingulodinium_polyedra.AAC.1